MELPGRFSLIETLFPPKKKFLPKSGIFVVTRSLVGGERTESEKRRKIIVSVKRDYKQFQLRGGDHVTMTGACEGRNGASKLVSN